MRVAMAAALLMACAPPLMAQQREVRFSDLRVRDHLASDTLTAGRQRAPLPEGLFETQVLGGLAGLAVGALVGGLGGAILSEGRGPGDLSGFIGGMLLGTVVGSTVGIQVVSRRMGVRSNPLATFAGSVVGLAGGPLLFVTVPLGGTLAHNRFRR